MTNMEPSLSACWKMLDEMAENDPDGYSRLMKSSREEFEKCASKRKQQAVTPPQPKKPSPSPPEQEKGGSLLDKIGKIVHAESTEPEGPLMLSSSRPQPAGGPLIQVVSERKVTPSERTRRKESPDWAKQNADRAEGWDWVVSSDAVTLQTSPRRLLFTRHPDGQEEKVSWDEICAACGHNGRERPVEVQDVQVGKADIRFAVGRRGEADLERASWMTSIPFRSLDELPKWMTEGSVKVSVAWRTTADGFTLSLVFRKDDQS